MKTWEWKGKQHLKYHLKKNILINKGTNGCRLKSRTGESLDDSEQGNL